MKSIKVLAVVLVLVALGIIAEATRPKCSEFDRAQMPYWSQSDYEIYANCK